MDKPDGDGVLLFVRFISSRLLREEKEGRDFLNYRRQIRLTAAYRPLLAAIRLQR